MSLAKFQGIVFRTVQYGESSLIFDLYTKEEGLQSFIAKGVRSSKPNSRANLLSPMAWLQVEARIEEGRDLNYVREWGPLHLYQHLTQDMLRGNLGLLILEWARQCLRQPEAQAEIYQLLLDAYSFLDYAQKGLGNLPLWFIANLSKHLGFLPQADNLIIWDYRDQKAREQAPQHTFFLENPSLELLLNLPQLPVQAMEALPLERAWRAQFLEDLSRFYAYQLDNFRSLKTMEVLKEVLYT